MTRHDPRTRRTHGRVKRLTSRDQTVAASALAGGCLAVMTLWKAAAGNGATGGDSR